MTGRRPLPRAFPQAPGRCYLCRKELLEPRDASTMQIKGFWRLICRSAEECRERRQQKEQK